MEFAWVRPPLEEEQCQAISLICELVKNVNRTGVPYAIGLRIGFRDDGLLTSQLPGEGLTCATFVLALFERIGVEIIDKTTWPTGDEIEWQESVIARVAELAKRLDQDVTTHIEAMAADIGSARFKPEQVAAACCFASLPVPYEDVIEVAAQIAEHLRKRVAPLN